ncbi:MAG: hypothetical protein AAFU73_20030 [Planctomycetota bacterium]
MDESFGGALIVQRQCVNVLKFEGNSAHPEQNGHDVRLVVRQYL